MKIEDIFWHDSIIVRVVEPSGASVAFHVEYPENWERQLYANKTILFGGVSEYETHEIPSKGRVTILAASEDGAGDEGRRIRIETNAGYRLIRFKTLTVTDGHVTS